MSYILIYILIIRIFANNISINFLDQWKPPLRKFSVNSSFFNNLSLLIHICKITFKSNFVAVHWYIRSHHLINYNFTVFKSLKNLSILISTCLKWASSFIFFEWIVTEYIHMCSVASTCKSNFDRIHQSSYSSWCDFINIRYIRRL